MRITREIDYALRIMNTLAGREIKSSAAFISNEISVPLRFTLKILNKLVGVGFVRSYRGMDGGYELSKAPAEITLLDIVEAIDGPITINTCIGKDNECTCTDINKITCFYYHVFDDINACIAEKLRAITLDMAAKK